MLDFNKFYSILFYPTMIYMKANYTFLKYMIMPAIIITALGCGGPSSSKSSEPTINTAVVIDGYTKAIKKIKERLGKDNVGDITRDCVCSLIR